MKQYNIKAITNNDELKLIFECDKLKNIKCDKKHCGDEECNHTTDSRYMKAKARQRNQNITDKEIICNLESEIEYYRHELNLLRDVHRENVECINKQDKLIKEYQNLFKEILIDEKEIFNTRTPNQIRELLRFNAVNNKHNSKLLDKQFEITINDEEYIIKYNSNTDTIILNTYLTKLINEQDKKAIYKDKEFKIINKTRFNKILTLENEEGYSKEAE